MPDQGTIWAGDLIKIGGSWYTPDEVPYAFPKVDPACSDRYGTFGFLDVTEKTPESSPQPSSFVERGGGEKPRVIASTRNTGDQLLAGLDTHVLYRRQGECFVSDQDRNLLVWPYGAEPVAEGGRFGVKLPGRAVIWEGERITGGGGGLAPAEIASLPQVHPSCTHENTAFSMSYLD